MIRKEEIEKMKSERNVIFAALLFASAIALITVLMVWKSQITGYQTLNTFESDNIITGSSSDHSLRFETIPNFIAKAGKPISFKVNPNRQEVTFSDDTNMFDITPDGKVEFTPSTDDIGRHNVWIIIKDKSQHYYYQNVIIIVEE